MDPQKKTSMAAGEKLHTLSFVLQVTWLLSLIGMVNVLQRQLTQ